MSLPPPPPPLNTTTAPLPQTPTTAPLGPNPRRRASPPLPTGRRRCRGPPRPSSHSTEGRRHCRRSCCCSTTTPRALPGRCGRPPPRRWGLPQQSLPATTAQAPAPHQQPPPPSTAAPPAPRTTGRPRHQVQFPSSPSPIPARAAGSSSGPIYTPAPEHPAPSLPFERSSSSAPYSPEFPDPAYARPPTSAAYGGPTSPRFAKLNFTTYDGAEDPLNWLNQCEQFFRGQRTLASDRTWLASYHLRGTAQTWYYALEQDEGGMPPWDRFRELCLLRFGPPIRGSRLAALGRLPFTSTVQDYADRFQALACHAPGISGTSTPSR